MSKITYVNSTNLEQHKIAVHEYGTPMSNAIVLLHAFTHNAAFFKPLAEYLAMLGYYVIAPDMPGRGKSDYLVHARNYNYKLYVDDLFLIFNWLKIEKASLMGNSMGGITSVLFTEKYPRMVNKIILNDIGVVAPSAESMRIGKHVGRDFYIPTKGEMYKRLDEEFMQSNLSSRELDFVFDNYVIHKLEGYSFRYDQRLGDAFWIKNKQLRIPDLDFSENFGYLAKTCKDLGLYVIRGEKSNLLDLPNFERLTSCKQHRDNMVVQGKGHLPLFFNDEEKNKIAYWLT